MGSSNLNKYVMYVTEGVPQKSKFANYGHFSLSFYNYALIEVKDARNLRISVFAVTVTPSDYIYTCQIKTIPEKKEMDPNFIQFDTYRHIGHIARADK